MYILLSWISITYCIVYPDATDRNMLVMNMAEINFIGEINEEERKISGAPVFASCRIGK